jgi:hypothetical protein
MPTREFDGSSAKLSGLADRRLVNQYLGGGIVTGANALGPAFLSVPRDMNCRQHWRGVARFTPR